jgi:ABC-type branched-subunit amino acid transport system substrate-binding protein
MQNTHGLIASSVAVLAVGAIAAGCGSSGGSTASSAAPSGTSGGGGGGGKTLKVGLSSILSGAAAAAGQGTDAGVQAYFKMVNANGGVNGYKFTTEEKDNAYDSATSANVARQLVNDGVSFIITEGTDPLKATVQTANAAHVPIVGEIDGAIVTPPKDPYMTTYGVNPVYAREAANGARFIMNELHDKHPALVYTNLAGEDTSKTAFPGYLKAHGGKVSDIEAISPTTTDYTPFAQKLKSAGAKTVYSFLLDGQLPGLQKAAAAIGYQPQWVGWFDDYSPAYTKLAGKLAKGVDVSLFITPSTQKSDPHVQKYLSAMKKYGYSSQILNPAAEQGWTMAAIIVKGVSDSTRGGKSYSEDGFTNALDSLNAGAVGVVPAITYNSQTHSGATKSSFYKMQGGGRLKRLTPYQEMPQVSPSGGQ